MKKTQKILYFILIFIFFILIQTTVNAGNTTVEALKSKFPAGKFWNHYAGYDHNYWNGFEDSGSCNNPDGWTNDPCLFHNGTTAGYGQPDCNSFNGGQQCAGFARKLFYDYYGQYATNSTRINWPSVSQVKPGDVIRYTGDGAASGGHEVWVIGVDNDHLIVGECNYFKPCEISWDRWVNKSNISIQYLYSAPYEINDNQRDTEKPKINDFFINTVSTTANSIKVKAKASDNVGVTKMKFRIWRSGNSDTSGTTKWGTYDSSSGCWQVTFNESETKIINDYFCCVDGVAYDAEGNESATSAVYNFVFGKRVSGLGDFVARIVPKKDTNYCIGTSGDNNDDNLKLRRKSQTDTSQMWRFEEISTGIYKITNVKNGRSIDVEGGTGADYDDCNMQLWDYAGASQQQFLIQNFNGGYRIVPTNTKALRAIDFADAKAVDGGRILLYKAGNLEAQTWTFEKCAESIKLNTSSTTINGIGKTTALKVTFTPSNVANKNITWSSSNTKVAKVSLSGVVTAVAPGTATITAKTQDGSNKTATCKITVKDPLPFTDVKTSDWYYDAVSYVYKNNIILGTSNTKFEPTKNLTRGMVVTILHRMEGAPYVSGTSKFPDVKDTKAYYYVAVKWATKNNIVSGYSNGKFGPEDSITREQLAVMLNKYCRYKGKYKSQTASLSKFPDASKVSNFAKWEMQWAVGTGIITGKTQGTTKILDPQGIVSRAQAAAMFEKYCKNVK